MDRLETEFFTSLATVVFAILAIALYITSGAGAAFYAAVALAIIIGFLNAWMISRAGKAQVEHYRPKPSIVITPKVRPKSRPRGVKRRTR